MSSSSLSPFLTKPMATLDHDIQEIVHASCRTAFSILGMRALEQNGDKGAGVVFRAIRPDASQLELVHAKTGKRYPTAKIHASGFFECWLPGAKLFPYRLRITMPSGEILEEEDPYRFGLVLGEQDLYFWGEGTHYEAWKVMGAHFHQMEGVTGVRFSVWAPNARRVSVVGDFNQWDGRRHFMRLRVESGIWEIFIPNISMGALYKYEIVGHDGRLFVKGDPFAQRAQLRPDTACIVHQSSYQWKDDAWMKKRAQRDLYQSPVSIYEVHLGSWKRHPEDPHRWLTYRELADQLIPYVKERGFTHLELMPISEYPFDGSWGYQVGYYYAPTSRYGSPDDFKYFVDQCHQADIGVILDWVPAHFPKDAHGLARFDGTALYEHEDPRLGEHKDWGTLIFNYGRNEVSNFLIANALFWLDEYHLDSLRVDAVASMIYLDYSRKQGEWIPNKHGGRENLEAIQFMRRLNELVYQKYPGASTMAEESTSWGGVSKPIYNGGLGFGFKWNMGWMNDSLRYMALDPIHRKYHHSSASFSMVYAYHENFVLVLSHDEVVHGKGSLLDKMPGDRGSKFANLRMFYAWMFAHPGKKLLFMGAEIAQWKEWNFDHSLDWAVLFGEEHRGIDLLLRDLNFLYQKHPALYQTDHEPGGFEWLDVDNHEASIFAFMRKGPNQERIYCVINATPVDRHDYRMGVRAGSHLVEILNTNAKEYSGSGSGNLGQVPTQPIPWQRQPHSCSLMIPGLSAIWLKEV